MKLTLQIQLLPDNNQADQLKATMERFNQACSWLAEQAFEIKTANKISLQRQQGWYVLEYLTAACRAALGQPSACCLLPNSS